MIAPLLLLLAQAPAAAAPPATAFTAAPTVEDDRLRACIERAAKEGAAALDPAGRWLAETRGAARSKPLQCLGHTYAMLLRWQAAEDAFVQSAQAAGVGDPVRLAALRAQAGNAALAGGRAEPALAHLDAALAAWAGDPAARGQVALDRARALVALDRLPDAAVSLTAAQRDAPDEPIVWLLSATLARRQGDLAAAQWMIEVAGSLAPNDPDVGLEAGVIAVLGGREAAARQSWQSVRIAAPGTPAAATAAGYLAQLGAAGAEGVGR